MKRKLLHQSNFAKHEYDTENQILYSDWFPETEHMTVDDFKYEVQRWGEISKGIPLTYIYDDCCNFLYTINPEEQVWMAHQLNPIWVAAYVKKYAHIVPKEFITSLAVEQLFDEFFAMNLENQFELKHFGNDQTKEAYQWLFT